MCSCGNQEPHRLASRRTADGVRAELWSDGKVNLGNAAFWMTQERRIGLDAGWAVMEEVCLYTQHEWSALCAAAKVAFNGKHAQPLIQMRARLAKLPNSEVA